MNDVSDLIQFAALQSMCDNPGVDIIVNAVALTAELGGITKFEPADAERFAYIGDDAYSLQLIAECYTARYRGNFAFMLDMAGAMRRFQHLTAAQAKGVLNCMLAEARRNSSDRQRTVAAPKLVLEDGMYKLDETIYKVQHAVHGSQNQYAKVLEEQAVTEATPGDFRHAIAFGHPAKWVFNYAPGAINKLRPEHRMTIEEAKAFGALYGTCCVCGRTLTDETSIANGIGPICEGRI
jgi:uncharacterized protein DUF6011